VSSLAPSATGPTYRSPARKKSSSSAPTIGELWPRLHADLHTEWHVLARRDGVERAAPDEPDVAHAEQHVQARDVVRRVEARQRPEVADHPRVRGQEPVARLLVVAGDRDAEEAEPPGHADAPDRAGLVEPPPHRHLRPRPVLAPQLHQPERLPERARHAMRCRSVKNGRPAYMRHDPPIEFRSPSAPATSARPRNWLSINRPAQASRNPSPGAPRTGDVHSLTREIRVAEQDARDVRRARANAAADHDGRLVDRPYLGVDRAVVVRHDEDVRVRDERLRAEDALRLGAPQLLAAISRREQQESLDDVRLRRLVHRACDRAMTGTRRRLATDGASV
jgi:hypothetical protein